MGDDRAFDHGIGGVDVRFRERRGNPPFRDYERDIIARPESQKPSPMRGGTGSLSCRRIGHPQGVILGNRRRFAGCWLTWKRTRKHCAAGRMNWSLSSSLRRR